MRDQGRRRTPARPAQNRDEPAFRPHATAGGPRYLGAQALLCSTSSWPTSFYSCRFEQLCQSLARIEHARLHGVLRDADDLRHLFDRLVVVVDQIDDLPMVCRKSFQALPDDCTFVLLREGVFRIVRGILNCLCSFLVQFLVRPAPQRRECLEPRDCQQPGGNRRTPFEPISLTPYVKKDFADQVLCLGLVPDDTQYEPVNSNM